MGLTPLPAPRSSGHRRPSLRADFPFLIRPIRMPGVLPLSRLTALAAVVPLAVSQSVFSVSPVALGSSPGARASRASRPSRTRSPGRSATSSTHRDRTTRTTPARSLSCRAVPSSPSHCLRPTEGETARRTHAPGAASGTLTRFACGGGFRAISANRRARCRSEPWRRWMARARGPARKPSRSRPSRRSTGTDTSRSSRTSRSKSNRCRSSRRHAKDGNALAFASRSRGTGA